MLGPPRQSSAELFLYNFDLEDRIPADHPLRQVLELVEFDFVRPLVARFYGYNGHRSEDPVVILKLMFLLFFDNVASERELMRQVGYRMDYLWFLGMGVNEPIPHHSVLSKARRRWGKAIFEALFVRVVRQCVERGLVNGDKVHVDGSLVTANASQQSVLPGGPELVEQLKALYREQEQKLEGVEASAGRKNYYEKKNARLVSRTDPEAAIVKQSRSSYAQPRYKHHRVVDDQCGVVTAMVTTPGDVEENRELVRLVRQHERNTQEEVKTVVADCQYGTQDNLAWCGKVGIESHLGEFPQPRVEGILGVEQFRWDEERDCYWCPAGQALTRQPERKKKKRIRLYRAGRRVCQACPLYEQCTRSRQGIRKIARHVLQEEIDRARAQSRSPAARRSRVRRRSLIEGSFADAANNHHFKRSRWRGLARQLIQDYLIGVCQNVRLMLRHSGRRPAFAAARAALLQGFDRCIGVLRTVCWSRLPHTVTSAGPIG
jgi:transposase